MKKAVKFKVVRVGENKGLGNAMRVALDSCSFDLVARMDSDDISDYRRFERQLKAFSENPEADVIGGYITEFEEDPQNITGVRTVELDDSRIKADMKKRCAMNHVSVMLRKEAVIAAGGIEFFNFHQTLRTCGHRKETWQNAGHIDNRCLQLVTQLG